MVSAPCYYYILLIDDRTGGEEVSLYRSKSAAILARDEYVADRLFYDDAPDELEGYPDYIGGGLYAYAGPEDGDDYAEKEGL